MLHFIGVPPSQYVSACLTWGTPDFVHKWHDYRAYGDIDTDTDTIVFGNKATLKPVKWAWQDHELN